jgi:GTP-binding protein HflX
VGYTNAGKSSLLNAITGSDVLVQDQLFTTLDATVRKTAMPTGKEVLLSDTVGFVRDLPHQLIESFRSTLEEAVDTDLILHVVDASADQPESQIAAVRQTLQTIEAHEVPELLVLNKADAARPDALQRLRNLHPEAVVVSAVTGEGLDDLLERLELAVTPSTLTLEVLVPFERGDIVAMIHDVGEILSESHEEGGTRITARIPDRHVADLERFTS